MHTESAYLTQLLAGLTITDNGVYLINRVSVASVLEADVKGTNKGFFDEMIDQVLVDYQYNPSDPRFSVPDEEGNRYIPLDVAVGSWMRWATDGSDRATLLVSNLAIAGLIKLFDTTLPSKADSN